MRHGSLAVPGPAHLEEQPSPVEEDPAGLVQRTAIAEKVTGVRCPCCRFPLIARVGQDGPAFHCACPRCLLAGCHPGADGREAT